MPNYFANQMTPLLSEPIDLTETLAFCKIRPIESSILFILFI